MWIKFMLLFGAIIVWYYLNLTTPIHFHYMEKRSQDIMQYFSFCVPQTQTRFEMTWSLLKCLYFLWIISQSRLKYIVCRFWRWLVFKVVTREDCMCSRLYPLLCQGPFVHRNVNDLSCLHAYTRMSTFSIVVKNHH